MEKIIIQLCYLALIKKTGKERYIHEREREREKERERERERERASEGERDQAPGGTFLPRASHQAPPT